MIIFATGPATGTMIPTASRIAVGVKSPLTGTISASYMGGHFGPELKYAGWDGIIVTGVSAEPVTLVIDDVKVELRDAAHLWGKDTEETQAILRRELGDDFRTGAIGPAGENQVLVRQLHARAARRRPRRPGRRVRRQEAQGRRRARHAAGSRWPRRRPSTSPACKELHDIIMENPVRPAFRWAGTTGMLPVVNEAVGLPYTNHQDDKAPDVSAIHNEEIAKYVQRYEACSGCNVICGSVVEFERQGRHYRTERIEHESIWALGPNCGIVDLPAIMEANLLCDHLGIDTMTAGGAIAWAMEMTQRGLLTKEDTDGLDFSFGNADVLREAILKIGAREGFGDLLASGSRGAARALGKGEEYAMQVKGLDLSAYAPRGFTGMGLSYATTGRGADHNKAFTVAAEFLGVLGDYDRYALEGKPAPGQDACRTARRSSIR